MGENADNKFLNIISADILNMANWLSSSCQQSPQLQKSRRKIFNFSFTKKVNSFVSSKIITNYRHVVETQM